MAITREQILNRARGEIGVTEYPPNSNKVKYNNWYYGREVSGPDYKWCLTYVQWVYKDSGLLPSKTVSCSALYNEFKKRGMLTNNPEGADLVFYKWSNSKYPCEHIGIYEAAKDSSHFYSIEGNTSTNGSQDNGGAVLRRLRTKDKSVVAFVKLNFAEIPAQDKLATTTTSNKKSVDEVAWEIIKGKGGWGNNPGRRQKLEAAGYNYNEVRDRVNQLMARK